MRTNSIIRRTCYFLVVERQLINWSQIHWFGNISDIRVSWIASYAELPLVIYILSAWGRTLLDATIILHHDNIASHIGFARAFQVRSTHLCRARNWEWMLWPGSRTKSLLPLFSILPPFALTLINIKASTSTLITGDNDRIIKPCHIWLMCIDLAHWTSRLNMTNIHFLASIMASLTCVCLRDCFILCS